MLRRISQTTEPIWLSFPVKILIGQKIFLTIFDDGINPLFQNNCFKKPLPPPSPTFLFFFQPKIPHIYWMCVVLFFLQCRIRRYCLVKMHFFGEFPQSAWFSRKTLLPHLIELYKGWFFVCLFIPSGQVRLVEIILC